MTEPKPGEARRAQLVASLRVDCKGGSVTICDCFDASVADVWRALVNPARLGSWLGTFEGDLRLGGTVNAHFFASGWEGTCTIEVCEPERRLLVLMTETGTTDPQATEITLSPKGAQTMFVGEQRDIPVELLAAYGAGTQIHVEDLAAYLSGGPRCEARARWNELFPGYGAMEITRM